MTEYLRSTEERSAVSKLRKGLSKLEQMGWQWGSPPSTVDTLWALTREFEHVVYCATDYHGTKVKTVTRLDPVETCEVTVIMWKEDVK